MTSTSPVSAQLILISGDPDNFQQVIDLHDVNQNIGRAQNSDIVWGSLQISRKHATLEYLNHRWYIRDWSTNGLSVNSTKLKKGDLHLLMEADIISFIPTGAVRYRFRYVIDPLSRTASSAALAPARSTSSAAISRQHFAMALGRPPPRSNRMSNSFLVPPRARSPVIEELLVEDSHSDSDESNRSESLLSVDPPEEFLSFSGDEQNSPAPAPQVAEILEEDEDDDSESIFRVVSKRKNKSDTSDSESNSVDRKKKRPAREVIASSNDEDEPVPSSSKACSASGANSSSESKSIRLRGGDLLLTDADIDECTDVDKLKEYLRECAEKLTRTEIKFKTLEFERDMEREEFLQKQDNVQSHNAAFREETYKKVLELMESELSCSVCNDVFIQATVVDCGHTFCAFCINEWARKKSECPICRKPFRNRSRHIEMENYITRIFESMSGEIASRRRTSIKEREDQAKKAEAQATAEQTAQAQGLRHANFAQTAGHRYINFLAELSQINEIFVPRGRRAYTPRRSARIQDRGDNPAEPGAPGNARSRRRGRANATANNAAAVAPPILPPRHPPPASTRPVVGGVPPIPVVTLNDTQNDPPPPIGIGGFNVVNWYY